MKKLIYLLAICFAAGTSFGQQTPNNCTNYTSTGTSSATGYADPNAGCGSNVPGTITGGTAAWTGSGCTGTVVSTSTTGPVSCMTVSYGAVNTNDFGTFTTNNGGTLTVTAINAGVAGTVVGPYNCGTGAYGNVQVTVCSSIPFTQLILTNTGCTSGWVINCVDVGCMMTNLTGTQSPCIAGAYSTSGQVEFTSAPNTGQLIVEDCNGVQQAFNPPFASPTNYTLPGQNADGAGCDVTAYFTSDPLCTITSNYTAPICTCNIDNFTANIGLCDQLTDTYGLSGDITFTSPPVTGTLIVEVDNGTTIYDTIIQLPFVSPSNWSISGIPSDGSPSTVTVYFSDDLVCSSTIAYTAPTSCACNADIGTFTENVTGSSQNDYVLCFGDAIDVNTNNDWVGPGEMFNPPGPAYNPGVSWLMYSCPPTVALTPDVNNTVPSDPCFLGLVMDNNLTDINDLAWINAYPPGTFTNNTIYWVALTMYDQVGGTYSFVNGPVPCYEMGTPYAVQYLPDFSYTDIEDCQAGTAVVTVNGALPAIDGSNFTASNLMPLTASFANTTATDGGTITVNGLVGNEMWSFDIIDANGCPYTVTGGPFPPLEDPGFSYTGGVWCTSDVVQNPIITGVAGGNFVSTPAGLAINAANGQITPSTSTPGTYSITYTTPGVCFDDLTLDVVINEVPTVNPVANQMICVGTNFASVNFNGSMGTATYNWTNDNINIGTGTNGTDNVVSFSGQTTGGTEIANFTVIPSALNCVGPAETFIFTVNDLDDATFNYAPGLTYCQTATDPNLTITGLAGGTFSYVVSSGGPNLSINPATGDIVLATSDLGAYDITYNTATAGGSLCPQTTTLQLVVTPAPVADFTLGLYCANDADPLPLYVGNGSGGIFSSTAGLVINANTGEVDLDASTPGTYTVTNDINIIGCPIATHNDDITINEIPNANITGTITICPEDVNPNLDINITAGTPNWNVTYNVDGVPTTVNTAVTPLFINGAALGTYDLVSITDGNNCSNLIAGQAVIDNFPTPILDPLLNQYICEDNPLTIQTFSSTPVGSSYTWTNTSVSDLGFGMNGNGDIGTFNSQNGTGVPVNGTIDVTPTSTDGCVGPIESFIVTINPNPVVSFSGGPLSGCEPLAVTFTNTTLPVGQNCSWDFGNGNIVTGCGTVSNIYMAGDYDVSLFVTTAEGCSSQDTYNSYVSVSEVPEALFSFAPQEITVEDPIVEFTNSSINAYSYNWEFGDNSLNSAVENPIHQYTSQEPGEYLVTLWSYSLNGLCSDSVSQLVIIEDIIILYVPNIFTPDGDDYNETFLPVFTSGFDQYDYHLTIFNRWGETIFESYNAEAGWPGHYGDGGLVDDGVYIWQIEFKETMSDKRHTHRGHVTVLK
jgi:gliding motility-associated-like protein